MTRRVLETMTLLLGCYVMLSLVVFAGVDATNDLKAVSDEFDLQGDETGNESERDLYPKPSVSGLCHECSCPPVPECEAGVSRIVDGCGCCKVCAKQLGESCNQREVCDHHRGLHCDTNTSRCKARPGRPCFVSNQWHENGELFSPSCGVACTCIDGDIGCISKCKPPPPGCAYARPVKSQSDCCGEWRCPDRRQGSAIGTKSSFEFRGSCMIQTTNWSPCSRTCGFGLSERVTNDNDNCKLTKESRLCIIRPCKPMPETRKTKRSCRKVMRRKKRVQFSLSGCLTTKTYKPRYCGSCRHPDKCCKPDVTKTIELEFKCDASVAKGTTAPSSERYVLKRKMMWIQTCVCGNFCNRNAIEIQANSLRGLAGDTRPST